MGKTSKPLTIIALPPCNGWQELDALEAQGHIIKRITQADIDARGPEAYSDLALMAQADIIIGATAWRMNIHHHKYLKLALKEARMQRYPYKEKRADATLRKNVDDDLSVIDTIVPTDTPDDP